MESNEASPTSRVYGTHVRDHWFPGNTVDDCVGCQQEAQVRAEANIFGVAR